ncbi:MAG TPA: hypothetical protein VEQ40_13875 [Pyrinomonadaceae bacterium]|nr:hypothetical protein [Pyrinomonadaceae bacterium]
MKPRKAKKKELTATTARSVSELRAASERAMRPTANQIPTQQAASTARSVERSSEPASRAIPEREKLARLGLADSSQSMYCLRATKLSSQLPVACHER